MEQTNRAVDASRERREELERLQGELARVRRAIHSARESRDQVNATLKGEIVSAETELERVTGRLGEVTGECERLVPILVGLNAQMARKLDEEAVIARGRARLMRRPPDLLWLERAKLVFSVAILLLALGMGAYILLMIGARW